MQLSVFLKTLSWLHGFFIRIENVASSKKKTHIMIL
jgi:hypothetical protein